MNLQEFYEENQDRLNDMFDEHISYLQDSYEHITRVKKSERYFWEFVQEVMDKELQ
jgi:hypothetical protein